MSVAEIGQNAGIIWNQLNSKGALSYTALKFSTRLTDAELYAAIGWLARENKIKASGDTIHLI